MRRGFCRTIVGVACAVLLDHACLAQITLVSGDSVDVPSGPTFAAPSDFDGDGIADTVVSNTQSASVTVLLGSAPDSPTAGTFKSKVQIAVGRSVRGVTAGDFNQDGKQDVAVADYALSDVFVIPGNGDGTFRGAQTIPVPNSRPVAVAAGNFDNKLGTDIVAASGRTAALNVLLNLGGTKGFSVKPDIGLASIPKAVATADFDGDGFDDIAVLLPANRTADAISVLLNNGSGSFQGVVPANYVVGVAASALTIGDFNGDGAKDIAVVNAGQLVVNGANSQRRVSITILLNKTVKTNQGTTVGTGRFSVLPDFEIFCPSTVSGIPISCTPQGIGTADFNRDGFADLVVSFSTSAVASSQSTAGFVSAFSGRGDGTFDFAAQIPIGLGPRGLATGDFTGDHLPDVAVAEYGDSKVTLLRAVAPPPKVKGTPCNVGIECGSGFCVNQVCCETSSCPGDEQCNIHPTEGSCSPPGVNGNPCETAVQCSSGNCSPEGFCCSTATCASGMFCNTGTCAGPAPNGSPCTQNEQCQFNHCVDDICCGDDSCQSGQFCDIPGFQGQCNPPVGSGATCDKTTQCQSGLFCTDQVCCNVAECDVNEFCNVLGSEGQCIAVPTAVPTGTPTLTPTMSPTPTITSTSTLTETPTITPTPQPTGATCGGGPQCLSGNCMNGICCVSACTGTQRCDIVGKTGTCSELVTTGGACTMDEQCASMNCSGGFCGAVRTPTNTPILPTATPVPPGAGCTSAAQCQPGFFCSSPEGVCCDSASCAPPLSCRFAGSEGECTAPTPTATPLLANGESCDPNNPNACASGNCTDGVAPDSGSNPVCCDSPSCEAPALCNIFNLEGSCNQPLPVDEPCDKNSDCAGGFNCQFDSTLGYNACEPPNTPVPTAVLLPTATPTLSSADLIVSRSGGCSIGGGSDPAGAWVLAGLPLVLWLRRTRMQGVRSLIRRLGK